MPDERIGFLGLGIMGSRMAANVARAGFPLSGVDPHARARPSAGRPSTARRACATPAEVAARQRRSW